MSLHNDEFSQLIYGSFLVSLKYLFLPRTMDLKMFRLLFRRSKRALLSFWKLGIFSNLSSLILMVNHELFWFFGQFRFEDVNLVLKFGYVSFLYFLGTSS